MEAKTKQNTEKITSTQLSEAVVDSILDTKGKDVVVMDLRELTDAFCDYFVICHGTSTTQVKSIGENIVERIKKEFDDRPLSSEGKTNSEWVLVDYVNVVIHIFLKDRREFYQLEELWGDAKVTRYSDEGDVIV